MKAMRIVQAALVCGATLGITGTLSAQEPRKPVGVWSFEEESGHAIKDTSGQGNDGYISRANLQDVVRTEGRIGKGLEFKGEFKNGGDVVIPGISKKYGFFTNGVTIETWIKFHDTRDKGKQYEIVSNTMGDNGKGFRLKFGNAWLYFMSGDGTKPWGAHQNEIKYPIKPNVWYFIAAVYDGVTFKIYVDGELAGTSKQGSLLTAGNPGMDIGGYMNGYAYRFDGFIDEVRLYDYPRTDAQILGDARAD